MNNKLLKLALFAFLFGSSVAFAASGKITITSPADGAMVGSGDKIKLNYEAVPGPEGDHLHLNVDGKRVDVLRQLKGATEIDALAPGKHQICIAVVALVTKMLCAATGFLLVAAYILWGANWPERKGNAALLSSVILAVIALSSAAFLRWF